MTFMPPPASNELALAGDQNQNPKRKRGPVVQSAGASLTLRVTHGARALEPCRAPNWQTVATSSLRPRRLGRVSDGPAFVALVERFRPRVWRICYRLLNNEQDAADAAQEVFLRLFLHRGRYAGRSKYATWVHAVAVKTCLTMRRGRGRRRRHESVADDEGWEARQAARPDAPKGASLDLLTMLETLPEEDRAMLLLKYAEGYEYEELAAIFELSVSACKMRISRARDKLQSRFPET